MFRYWLLFYRGQVTADDQHRGPVRVLAVWRVTVPVYPAVPEHAGLQREQCWGPATGCQLSREPVCHPNFLSWWVGQGQKD